MEQFGEIEFQEVTEEYGEGMYDGRKFLLFAHKVDADGNVADGLIEGNFSDEERLFIFTQWEMKQ